MTEQTEARPAKVPETAIQAGEIRNRWWWVEPEVWTDRMLAALEQGVKGGKWFSLIDKVFSEKSLLCAFQKVKKNQGSSGVDHQTIEQFESRLKENVAILANSLKNGTYKPLPILRRYIPKLGSKELRPLGVPAIRDRLVQTSLRNAIEPIFEIEFADQSYGFRPGKGCKDALRRVDSLLREDYVWIVDVDLKSYFDTIPHEKLMKKVEDKIADGRILSLINSYLHQNVMEGAKEWAPDRGTPQGAIISPLLSNIYLDPLDHLMENMKVEMVRYADDMICLCQTEEEAGKAYAILGEWAKEAGLIIHPEKTRIVNALEKGGFDFLGYHFEQRKKWPRKKSMEKFKNSIREKTKRNNGTSLCVIITKINKTLKGWFEYFKHSIRWTFPALDRWIRVRLRSILRKRRGGRGRGRGTDHQRWPNRFFQEMGLFSLEEAHIKVCQPQH